MWILYCPAFCHSYEMKTLNVKTRRERRDSGGQNCSYFYWVELFKTDKYLSIILEKTSNL